MREYPIADWQHEVANGDTVRGYYEWAANKRDEEEEGCSEKPCLFSVTVERIETTSIVVEVEAGDSLEAEALAVQKAAGIHKDEYALTDVFRHALESEEVER